MQLDHFEMHFTCFHYHWVKHELYYTNLQLDVIDWVFQFVIFETRRRHINLQLKKIPFENGEPKCCGNSVFYKVYIDWNTLQIRNFVPRYMFPLKLIYDIYRWFDLKWLCTCDTQWVVEPWPVGTLIWLRLKLQRRPQLDECFHGWANSLKRT